MGSFNKCVWRHYSLDVTALSASSGRWLMANAPVFNCENLASFGPNIVEKVPKMPKKRSTAGLVALPVFLVTVVCICVSFSTTHWLENWDKYYGDKFDKLGLWVHCFRSLPDPHDALHLRYFTGCRWVFNPFTAGYAEMRDFLMPRKIDKLLLLNPNLTFVLFCSLLCCGAVFLHRVLHAHACWYNWNIHVCSLLYLWASS